MGSEFVKINEYDFVLMNFSLPSREGIGEISNQMFIGSLSGQLLLGSFSYPQVDKNLWEPIGKEIVNSLRINF